MLGRKYEQEPFGHRKGNHFKSKPRKIVLAIFSAVKEAKRNFIYGIVVCWMLGVFKALQILQ